ncbi:hypothetical protein EJ06DRAFT_518653 [Trichodelitschia bisporula]|uniref:MULE transposase domain-containing protein n=1 Tax=Trichodelitschia bisporula TaxID=703511 RepID=A0A6G1I7M6_9PEZI|nr:hypothetical protein EJ06DRAFT_518653 [Trichodelitschia bisporula]
MRRLYWKHQRQLPQINAEVVATGYLPRGSEFIALCRGEWHAWEVDGRDPRVSGQATALSLATQKLLQTSNVWGTGLLMFVNVRVGNTICDPSGPIHPSEVPDPVVSYQTPLAIPVVSYQTPLAIYTARVIENENKQLNRKCPVKEINAEQNRQTSSRFRTISRWAPFAEGDVNCELMPTPPNALGNALAHIFPDVPQLLCIWHVEMNEQKHASNDWVIHAGMSKKMKKEQQGLRDTLLARWKACLSATMSAPKSSRDASLPSTTKGSRNDEAPIDEKAKQPTATEKKPIKMPS